MLPPPSPRGRVRFSGFDEIRDLPMTDADRDARLTSDEEPLVALGMQHKICVGETPGQRACVPAACEASAAAAGPKSATDAATAEKPPGK